MFSSFSRNIFKTKSAGVVTPPMSIPIQLSSPPGEDNTTAACLVSSGTTYYIDSSAPIATGLEIFTDPGLTTRLYLSDPLAPGKYLWLERTGFTAAVDFDATGLVDNVVSCTPILNPITVTDTSSADPGCYSCTDFEIDVPADTTYVLQVISAFDSNANYAGGFCSGSGTTIASDGVINMPGGPTGTTYQFNAGIEVAQAGVNPFFSQIFLNVRLNNVAGPLVDQLILSRSHTNANC